MSDSGPLSVSGGVFRDLRVSPEHPGLKADGAGEHLFGISWLVECFFQGPVDISGCLPKALVYIRWDLCSFHFLGIPGPLRDYGLLEKTTRGEEIWPFTSCLGSLLGDPEAFLVRRGTHLGGSFGPP